MEGATVERMKEDIWRLKASTAHLLVCEVCGDNTKWGANKRGVRLCDEHNTWKTYFRLRFSNSSAA